MKKFQVTLIMLAFATCLMSCKASSSKAKAEVEAETAAANNNELIVNTDSCVKEEGNTLRCCIKVDYPTEPTELSKQVRQILNKELAKLYLPAINGEENTQCKPYAGDLSNGNTVIESYAKTNFEYLQGQMKEMKDLDSSIKISMSYDVQLSKQEETDSYVTYACNTYAFLGGAHGSASSYALNIVKATGKVLTETVDTTKVKELQAILRKGTLEYLNADNPDEKITEDNLKDYLFVDNGIIPLPAQTPFLAKDGVHFIYQQYEIGPYAMGMVQFTVPYKDIKPYLTQEAIHLLK